MGPLRGETGLLSPAKGFPLYTWGVTETIDRQESARLLYGAFTPRDVPRYTIAQAARYVGLSPATLRSWVRGRSYPKGGEPARAEP